MRIVIQRVSSAKSVVDGKITGEIGKGYLLLIGFTNSDTEEDLEKAVYKVSGLRVFEDEAGKMNKSLVDVNGSILAISQFTLYADLKHGHRPSFTEAMKFDLANEYYKKFCNMLRDKGFIVEEGIFGADMKISLTNDGPVTIIFDSKELK